jgi:hypothetical protein
MFWQRLHLIVGLLALIAFVLTGQVMKHHEPAMRELSEAVRLMYRSRHIYILAAAVPNALLALYYTPLKSWRHWIQCVGCGVFLVAPFFATWAFFVEPERGFIGHSWHSAYPMFGIFGATLLHLLARLGARE